MTHWTSVKEAPSDRPIAGRETATILESSMINEETSDAVRSSHDFEAASSFALLAKFDIGTSLFVASERVGATRVSTKLARWWLSAGLIPRAALPPPAGKLVLQEAVDHLPGCSQLG